MDAYTREVKDWLEQRFRTVDAAGVYFAHQPIYGFRVGHSEERLVERYVITWQIMKALARLRFESLLDVGGAEGYKAALARDLLGVRVRTCDLSAEACRRAGEIFGLEGEAVDVCALPFADGEFDVVLASETLEHVQDLERATRELLRVARRAVVLTVPREPGAIVERNVRERRIGSHIHALHATSFDRFVPPGAQLRLTPILSAFLKIPFALVEASQREQVERYPVALLGLYNRAVPILRRAFGRASVLRMMRLDETLAPLAASYSGMLFVIVKDPGWVRDAPSVEIPPERIVDFAVPLHRPRVDAASAG
jgi:SAM-dependent methyltransferase